MTMRSEIRVIFCLDEKLASALNEAANKKGITKSKLIREWLEGIDNFKSPYIQPLKRNKYYNLYLDSELVKNVDSLAQRCGKTRSSLLYHFLYYKLCDQSSVEHKKALYYNKLNESWEKGDFTSAVNYVGDKVDLLSIDGKLLFAKILMEMGKLQEAGSVMSEIERATYKSPNPQRVEAHLHILKTRLYRIRRDLNKSKSYALEALRVGESIRDREVIGLAHYRLGVLALGQEQFDEAICQFERALEYFDIQNHPLHYVQVYFSMTYCYTYKNDYENYIKYMNRTKEILKIHPNYYYEAVVAHAQLVTSYLNNLEINDSEISDRGVELAHKSGSVLSIHDHYEVRGMINFMKESTDKSVSDLDRALSLELKYISSNETSYAYVMKVLLESKDNFDKALPEIEKLMRKCNEEGVHVRLREHLISGMKYIYSKKKDFIEEGRKNLVRLSHDSETLLLKRAAKNILEKKQLFLVE